VLDTVFAESEKHAAPYVDRAAIEARMRGIIAPKVGWCVECFRARAKREPSRLIDVGAGGGHFLAGAASSGLAVEGFERSRASRAFAKEAFGLVLRDDDFLTARLEPADIVTFWGLLEYVQEPRAFLAAARRALGADGMLIVEVPRVDSLGTLVQAADCAVIARHMDPTTHVSAFSDESLCTALIEEGFAPVAAWYFGMDAYEALVQAAFRAEDESLLSKLADLIPVLQEAVDRGRQCDDIVVAAVPARH
jgi:2-polyprenyl-3-methyl-5-hydroxy-6-metoxy-1,4-benzoquinol methylase